MADNISSVSKVAEAYKIIQDANSDTLPNLKDEFLQLVFAINNTSVAPHVRLRALQMVGEHGARFEKNETKKAAQEIVTLLSEEDIEKSPVQLLVAGVNAFVSICKGITVKQDELVKATTDLFIQIIVGKSAFPDAVLAAAKTGLTELTNACFSGVVRKLMHLLSDERDSDEDMDQIKNEREFSLTTLRSLAKDAKHAQEWTDDLIQLLYHIFLTATAVELQQLIYIASEIPLVKSTGGVALLDVLLKPIAKEGGKKMDTPRFYESLCLISPTVSPTVIHDSVGEKVLAMISTQSTAAAVAPKGKKSAAQKKVDAAGKVEEDRGLPVWMARALVVAASTASNDMCEKLAPVVFQQIEKSLATVSDAPESETEKKTHVLVENITVLEAFLVALAAIGAKVPAVVSEKLNSEDSASFIDKCNILYSSLDHFHKSATYSVKKKIVDQKAVEGDAEVLAALSNAKTLLGSITTKHIPVATTITPSWVSAKLPPHMNPKATTESGNKRDRKENGNGAPSLDTPLGDQIKGPVNKKARTQSSGNGHNNHRRIHLNGGGRGGGNFRRRL
eukprot:Tbor_TRINITY_DN5993_c1_g3::TRINITY_DN5993_c1_g3_i1::g.18280::m.18280